MRNIKTALDDVQSAYENGEVEGNEFSPKAMDWYRQELSDLLEGKLTNVASLIRQTPEYRVRRVFLGKMILFGYIPETPVAKLGYYDRFPLVIPIRLYRDHFMAVNLHYMPFKLRASFIDRAEDAARGDVDTGDARLTALRYDLMKSSTKYLSGLVGIRKYKLKGIYTPTLEIPSDKWKYAINLPVARFYGSGAPVRQMTVLNDSRQKIQDIRNRNI